MGITIFSKSLIEKAVQYKPGIKSVIELGSQNDYTTAETLPPFADKLYKKLGIDDYTCIDLAGDNNAREKDLSFMWLVKDDFKFDLVTDFGTSEHISHTMYRESVPFLDGYINSVYPKNKPTIEEIKHGYYNCWLNKFNLCKEGGLIISENPLTGNWPGHGYSYLGKNFYDEICKIADLKIIEQGLEPATGNTTDGWNVWSILQKTGNKFPSYQEFNQLPIYRE